jgi:hypothetical protein
MIESFVRLLLCVIGGNLRFRQRGRRSSREDARKSRRDAKHQPLLQSLIDYFYSSLVFRSAPPQASFISRLQRFAQSQTLLIFAPSRRAPRGSFSNIQELGHAISDAGPHSRGCHAPGGGLSLRRGGQRGTSSRASGRIDRGLRPDRSGQP